MQIYMGILWCLIFFISFISCIYKVINVQDTKLFMLSSAAAFFAWAFELSISTQCLIYLFAIATVMLENFFFEVLKKIKKQELAIVLIPLCDYGACLVKFKDKIMTAVCKNGDFFEKGEVVEIISENDGVLTICNRSYIINALFKKY